MWRLILTIVGINDRKFASRTGRRAQKIHSIKFVMVEWDQKGEILVSHSLLCINVHPQSYEMTSTLTMNGNLPTLPPNSFNNENSFLYLFFYIKALTTATRTVSIRVGKHKFGTQLCIRPVHYRSRQKQRG